MMTQTTNAIETITKPINLALCKVGSAIVTERRGEYEADVEVSVQLPSGEVVEVLVSAGVEAYLRGTAKAAGTTRGMETLWGGSDSIDGWMPEELLVGVSEVDLPERADSVLGLVWRDALDAWSTGDETESDGDAASIAAAAAAGARCGKVDASATIADAVREYRRGERDEDLPDAVDAADVTLRDDALHTARESLDPSLDTEDEIAAFVDAYCEAYAKRINDERYDAVEAD